MIVYLAQHHLPEKSHSQKPFALYVIECLILALCIKTFVAKKTILSSFFFKISMYV